jgi:hypothetical protein
MTDVKLNISTAYLAGPMRGIPEYNFPAFLRAAALLREQGWTIHSPAERDIEEGFDPKTDEAKSLDYYMQHDLAAVCSHDAVILLGGWEDSQGARLEAMVADEVGHPVFELVGEELRAVNPDYIWQTFITRGSIPYPEDFEEANAPSPQWISPNPEWSKIMNYGEHNWVSRDVCGPKCGDTVCQPECGDNTTMRTFGTGATRNVEVDPDYHGFFSPLSMHAYGEYMHAHRLQSDGTIRDSDNWQLGMPNDAYVRSLVRHIHDVELIHDGFKELARSDARDPSTFKAHLSAIIFNAQGILHNLVKEDIEAQREAEPYSMFEEILRLIPCR